MAPLTGIRVIDLTIWVQGPVAGTLLADLGADVIKIEKAGGGDFSRNLGSLFGVDIRRDDAPSLVWQLCNRNKRTITLDLHREAARPVFRRLLEGADVLVTNLHPEALAEFEADEPSVRKVNPRIVYARAGGFGERGPWANDPCQDTVGMAYAGFMFTASGDPDEPYYPPGALSDVLSGTVLSFGILAALMQRGRTGEGQYVSTSQMQSLMWLQSLNIGAVANLGQPFAVSDRHNPPNPMFNVYRCGDGRWVALGMMLSHQFVQFCEAVGLQELLRDERFQRVAGRLANAAELAGLIETHLATRPAAYWLAVMRAAGLWVAPVNRHAELLEDEQVRANGYLMRLEDGTRTPLMPFSLTGHQPALRPSPAYGADTDAVLAESGLSEDEILALRVDGAVW